MFKELIIYIVLSLFRIIILFGDNTIQVCE